MSDGRERRDWNGSGRPRGQGGGFEVEEKVSEGLREGRREERGIVCFVGEKKSVVVSR